MSVWKDELEGEFVEREAFCTTYYCQIAAEKGWVLEYANEERDGDKAASGPDSGSVCMHNDKSSENLLTNVRLPGED